MLLTILSCMMVVFSTPTSLLWSTTLLCQFIPCSSNLWSLWHLHACPTSLAKTHTRNARRRMIYNCSSAFVEMI